jgi:queuosine precursor transporter
MLHAAEKSVLVVPEGKYLWFLLLSFSMIVSISNWYDARLIAILGFAISPGSLSYPLSFLVSNSITEVYGYKKARLSIWTGLFF